MDAEMVARVRRFQRTVTQRAGALDDPYLGSGRPLGEARLLWEIGPDGSDVRELRSRLDLDSGYLSRLLRSLTGDGVVVVEPDPADRRVRRVRPTERGRIEWAELDRRSDDAATGLLAPLSPGQRDRLVGAMREVERLLLASAVLVSVRDPRDATAVACLERYVAEVGERFEGGFDPARSVPAGPQELSPPAGLLLVATLHGDPVGCGALKFHPDGSAEVKRMWTAQDARGLGLGRRLLGELEQQALSHRARIVRLDTNAALVEAIALYRSAGYREVAAFNSNPYADHWFEKLLP